MAEATVADEVDDDVVAEAAPVGEGEADGGDRGLRIVGVDVHDRRVEALRQVGRVAGRAALARIGGEADLVVRDQVQRPARRVAGEAFEVERLRDDALARERCVAVDQDRQGDGRVVDALAGRSVGLLGTREALDHGVDRLEMARVGRERDGDLAGRRRVHALGAEVVLHVARAALGIADDGGDRPLAFELAQDLLVGLADRVREHVQPPAVRHTDHDLVRTARRGQLDGLVQHGHEHVEPFGGELLLPEEGATEVLLERLGARQPLEQRALLVGAERLPVATRLDHPPQPRALLVVGDVLDLVRDRAAVGLDEVRQRLGERLSGDVEAEDRGRDARLQLEGQRRLGAVGLERGIADGLGSEGVEPRREVTERAVGADELGRGRDGAQELRVDLCRRRGSRRHGGRRCGLGGRRSRVPVLAGAQRLEQSGEAGVRGDELARAALEQAPPLLRHRLRVLEIVLEEGLRVTRVQLVDVVHRRVFLAPGRGLLRPGGGSAT